MLGYLAEHCCFYIKMGLTMTAKPIRYKEKLYYYFFVFFILLIQIITPVTGKEVAIRQEIK